MAEKLNVGVTERLAAAAQSLNEYVDLEDKLADLLKYLESKDPRDEDGDSELGYYERQYQGPAYHDAATRLRKILDGE